MCIMYVCWCTFYNLVDPLLYCITGEGCQGYRDSKYKMGGFWAYDEV